MGLRESYQKELTMWEMDQRMVTVLKHPETVIVLLFHSEVLISSEITVEIIVVHPGALLSS